MMPPCLISKNMSQNDTRVGEGPTPELTVVSLNLDSGIESQWVIFPQYSKRKSNPLKVVLNLT